MQGEQETVSKKKIGITTLSIALGVLIGVIIGIVFYNAPSQKANRYLDLGGKYLGELNYADAVIQFQNAYDINPNNSKIVAVIDGHLKSMLKMAAEAEAKGDFDTELTILEAVNSFRAIGLPISDTMMGVDETLKTAKKKERISVLIEKADEDFYSGDYEDAEEKYEQAMDEGATDDDVSPRLELSKVFRKLISLCESSDWEGVAQYIDSYEFDGIMEYLQRQSPVYVIANKGLIIGSNDGDIYVLYGDLNEKTPNGVAAGVVSAVNIYSLYEGGWKNYIPNGSGTLTIWNKEESISDATILEGNIRNGLLDGETIYRGGSLIGVQLVINNGELVTVGTTDVGENYVVESDDGKKYLAKDISEFNLGLTGYGGSDKKLVLSIIDAEELDNKSTDSGDEVIGDEIDEGDDKVIDVTPTIAKGDLSRYLGQSITQVSQTLQGEKNLYTHGFYDYAEWYRYDAQDYMDYVFSALDDGVETVFRIETETGDWNICGVNPKDSLEKATQILTSSGWSVTVIGADSENGTHNVFNKGNLEFDYYEDIFYGVQLRYGYADH